MAKRIKMTFRTKPEGRGYCESVVIVDDAEKIMTMTDVAAYLIEHAVGFESYSVEVEEKECEEE